MGELMYSEFRQPRQMLGTQEYDGHLSIHDDKMAGDLGLAALRLKGQLILANLCRFFIRSMATSGL